MKKRLSQIVYTASLLALMGCRNHYQGEVVKETYVHKYGVPVSATDWDKQGQDGQVVQLQKDGVTVVRSYNKGVQSGETTWSFPNSDTLAKVERFQNGQLTSVCENYASGLPMQEEIFDTAGNLVKRLKWYEDGTPSAVEMFQQGFLVNAEYRSPLNMIESRVENGIGTRICRNTEGELVFKEKIEQGSLVERVNFYSNGDPCTITPFKEGKVSGSRLTFFRGGLPKAIENWVNDRQDGTTVLYHNGEKIAEVPFVEGKKHGVELRFRDGENLVEEVSWHNDIQHGPHKIYVDGQTKVEWYHQGEVVSRPTFERLNPPKVER
jgi:antitoxin component YwqK of YwqJK toxin-antitoxin module